MDFRCFALYLLAFTFPAMAIETPDYKTLEKDGNFELRDYPGMTVARTAAGDGDFMRLFRYISGNNAAGQKIAMTAPVLVQHEGEKKVMSFVVPREVASAAPQPGGKDVAVERVEAARFAVFTHSGRRTESNESAALAKLQAWTAGRKIRTEGEPVFAYYDPPWTLPFLRRNEVMLRVARDSPIPAPR